MSGLHRCSGESRCTNLDRIAALEAKLNEAQARLETLEARPLAGRPPERIVQAIAWLEGAMRGRGKRASSVDGIVGRDLLRAGVKAGFSEALIRKAGNRLGIRKEKGRWTLAL